MIVEKIDQMLAEDDLDHDGYISYTEFALARRTTRVLHEAEEGAASYGAE